MDLASQNAQSNRTRQRLRKDLRLLTLFLLPFSEEFRDDPEWLAGRLGINKESVSEMRSELLRSGMWVRAQDGSIRPSQAKTGLGDDGGTALTPAQYLTMSSEIISRVDTKAPNTWGEVHTVVTSHALKKEFITKIQQALIDLLNQSASAKGETVMSWAHGFIDTIDALKREGNL